MKHILLNLATFHNIRPINNRQFAFCMTPPTVSTLPFEQCYCTPESVTYSVFEIDGDNYKPVHWVLGFSETKPSKEKLNELEAAAYAYERDTRKIP